MKHTAQDVLRAEEAGNFPYPFTLEDAQKVLDASPEPVTIDRCVFIWIDEGDGLLRIHSTEKPQYTLNHPASLPSLGGRIRKFKEKLSVVEDKKKPKTLGPR